MVVEKNYINRLNTHQRLYLYWLKIKNDYTTEIKKKKKKEIKDSNNEEIYNIWIVIKNFRLKKKEQTKNLRCIASILSNWERLGYRNWMLSNFLQMTVFRFSLSVCLVSIYPDKRTIK